MGDGGRADQAWAKKKTSAGIKDETTLATDFVYLHFGGVHYAVLHGER
jgi:hypothetical protein